MRANRFVVALLLLVIASACLAIARRGLLPAGEQPAPLDPRLAPRDPAEMPSGRYGAILREAGEADVRVVQAIRAAPVEEKRAGLARRREVRRAFADRFLALARDLADDPAASDTAVDALTWVIVHCPVDPQGEEAVERLVRGPIRSERLADACQRLDAEELAIAEPVFRAVLRHNPHASARGHASLALARALRRQSERVGPGRVELARGPDLVREAESLYEDAIARYGGVRIGRGTLAGAAEAELFELRRLGIGREAPEIEGLDLEGRAMALSDFRGKVVALEFWGHW